MDFVCDPIPIPIRSSSSLLEQLSLNSPPRETPAPPSAFDSLPQELLEHIGAQLSRLSPLGPPTTLLPLLLVSRRFNDTLGAANDGFYSDLFKERFDWKSVDRRWNKMKQIEDMREKREVLEGGGVEARPDGDLKLTYGSFTRPSSPSELPLSTSPWRPLTTRDYAAEFKRRCVVLTKVRMASTTGVIPPNSSRPSSPRLQPLFSAAGSYKSTLDEPDELTQNLWTCYLMLSENDGKNLRHLLEYANLKTYTKLFYEHSLLSDALKPGWPRQSAGRGLGLWIGWLGGDDLASESAKESDERFFVLKPYVFGAHKFEAFYAPWTITRLPVHPSTHPLRPPPLDPFSADLRPRTQAQSIQHMGRRISIAPPILSHAAIFSFFFRIEQDPESSAQLDVMATLPANQFRQPPPMHPMGAPITTVKPTKTLLPVLESKLHDRDFLRLASCVDPYSSLGLPTLYSGPELTGSWEGRFSFFDFDSYRDMLGGRMRSLYEGPFGDQPQVWKLEMKVVRVADRNSRGGSGPLLNAGFEVGGSGGNPTVGGGSATGGPVRLSTSPGRSSLMGGPASASSSTGMGPPPGRPSSLGGGGRRKSVEGPGDWFEEEGKGRANKRPRSVQEEGPCMDGDDDDDDDDTSVNDGDFETLLTGSGHSAWGQFILKGRVRAWDGLFSIVKQYSSDSSGPRETRGRWLYRGYCVGGNTLVGRWRDTHTPEDLNGYEGTWCMQRRQE